jgi:hypothetical protein
MWIPVCVCVRDVRVCVCVRVSAAQQITPRGSSKSERSQILCAHWRLPRKFPKALGICKSPVSKTVLAEALPGCPPHPQIGVTACFDAASRPAGTTGSEIYRRHAVYISGALRVQTKPPGPGRVSALGCSVCRRERGRSARLPGVRMCV